MSVLGDARASSSTIFAGISNGTQPQDVVLLLESTSAESCIHPRNDGLRAVARTPRPSRRTRAHAVENLRSTGTGPTRSEREPW